MINIENIIPINKLFQGQLFNLFVCIKANRQSLSDLAAHNDKLLSLKSGFIGVLKWKYLVVFFSFDDFYGLVGKG